MCILFIERSNESYARELTSGNSSRYYSRTNIASVVGKKGKPADAFS